MCNKNDNLYHGELDQKLIWSPESDGGKYYQHRIPGMVVTKKGTVIIYCEARTGDLTNAAGQWGDWCLMDIYLQRSTDGGDTFSAPYYICHGNDTTPCVNNPVIIVGNDNVLHFLYAKNYSILGGGIWYRRSYDDGVTWTEEKQLTGYTDVAHDCFAFGPTHGICTKEGVLMTAVWYVPQGKGAHVFSHGPSHAAVFYSEDNGESWKMTDPASKNTNETDIVQLSDGSIMLNSRSGCKYRQVTVSPNGKDQWSETFNELQHPDPGCCAGLAIADVASLPRAVLFSNCESQTDREYVTVKCSFDDGKTYSKKLVLSGEKFGGYSDIYVDDRGCVYVLYEYQAGKNVYLARFSYADVFCSEEA